ncbi:MAG: flagellin FliC [Chloroflexota bacterium]|nr:MAG: flagellin FliC [Chloroflexota bacterium]
MVTSINTNISSLNSARLLNITNQNLARTTERLSSGLRINRSADDPSGLFAAESLTSEIRGNAAAALNIQSASSAIQVADSALSNIYDVVQRMRELAVQANNSLNSAEQFTALNNEFVSLRSAVTSMANGAKYAGTSLLTGALTTLTLQIGSAAAATQAFTFATQGFTATDLGINASVISSQANAATAITALDTAITSLSTGRSTLGASDQALASLKQAAEVSVVSSSEARSRIRDADIATEVGNLVKAQIQQQAGAAALSAANFSTQFILQLMQ